MKKIIRAAVVGVALVLGLGLAGCSSSGHSEQESFAFSGDTLNVVHNNSYPKYFPLKHAADTSFANT